MARDLAAAYEKRFPHTGCTEAQKEERMERLLHREDQQAHRRTNRTRGIIVPTLPWMEETT